MEVVARKPLKYGHNDDSRLFFTEVIYAPSSYVYNIVYNIMHLTPQFLLIIIIIKDYLN